AVAFPPRVAQNGPILIVACSQFHPLERNAMADIRPERVLADLRTLATFGAYKSGVHRPTLSEPDIAARQWFVGRLCEAGLDATIDGIANILGQSPAPGRKVLAGSHLESQNYAGWLDGSLGGVCAPEAAAAMPAGPAP